jgi:hypothetical protein
MITPPNRARRATTKLLRLKPHRMLVYEKIPRLFTKVSFWFGQIVFSCQGDHLLTYFKKSDYFNYRVLRTPYIGSADTRTTNSEIIRRTVWTITAQKPRPVRLWNVRNVSKLSLIYNTCSRRIKFHYIIKIDVDSLTSFRVKPDNCSDSYECCHGDHHLAGNWDVVSISGTPWSSSYFGYMTSQRNVQVDGNTVWAGLFLTHVEGGGRRGERSVAISIHKGTFTHPFELMKTEIRSLKSSLNGRTSATFAAILHK